MRGVGKNTVIQLLSVIVAIVGYFKFERKPNIHPANSIRHAYSRYEQVCANTIGVLMVLPYWLKFAALRLYDETMPI
jgi:hypothetical protein